MNSPIYRYTLQRERVSLLHDKAEAPHQTVEFLRGIGLHEEDREHVVVLCLDVRNGIRGYHVASIGTAASSMVHPREIFRLAVHDGASRIIISHNHPSGNPEPSKQDIAVTESIHKAGEILNIPLVDHLVVAEGGWVSLRQRGHCG